MRILPALTVAAGLAVANPAPSAHVLEDRGFLDDIWKMIEEATTCVACQVRHMSLSPLVDVSRRMPRIAELTRGKKKKI